MIYLYFFVRHTPFWSIPIMLISAEVGYIYWLRKKKQTALICAMLLTISLAFTIFYYWAGGPEKSVNVIKKIHRQYFQ